MSAAVKIARFAAQPHLDEPAHALAPMDVPAVKSPRPHRPKHARRKSSRDDGHPVAAVRHAFRRVLPKLWASTRSFNTLALNFYTAAIGLTAGVCIPEFGLTYVETVMLAVELSRAMDTSNVLLIVSEATDQLFVIHTHNLSARMDSYPRGDATVFARRSGGDYVLCEPDGWTHFDAPMDFLRGFLRQSTRQVLQTAEFGWSPLESIQNMKVLSSWLLEHPVVCLDQPGLVDVHPNLSSELCWHLRVRLEGYEPRYDHLLDLGSVPASLVNNTSLVQHDSHGDLLNLSVIQDRVQTAMFDRFNSNETVSVWSDITAEWVPSDGSTLLDA